MPKVSICIPTFNNITAFKRCFESVLKQTYTDYEVIITDDSTNNDIEDYLQTVQLSEKIIYKKNKTSLGSPENWNEAMRNANGEYIKILHHDDFFTRETSLQTFVDLLDNNPDADFAFVASINFHLSKNEIISYNKPSEKDINKIRINPEILLNGNIIGSPSATIFRNKYNVFFDKNLIWFVDLELYVSILLKNNKLVYISDLAITIGGDETRISNSVKDNKEINIFEYFYILDKWGVKKIRTSIFEQYLYFLFDKFNIKNKLDIRKSGYLGNLPHDITILLFKIRINKKQKTLKTFFKNKFYFFYRINPKKNNNSASEIYEKNNIIVGKDSIVESSKLGSNIKIGANSYLYNVDYGSFSYNSIRATIMNCNIGKFCSIAQGVSIGLGKHPINEFVSTHPAFYSIHKQCGYTFADKQTFNEMGEIFIGNDVWIGANSIICDDVKIGNGAVIAANSFVNHDVPDYAIVAGIPAKIIKYRFSTEEIDFLLKLKWWDKDISWLKNNKDLMLDIKRLMSNYNDHH